MIKYLLHSIILLAVIACSKEESLPGFSHVETNAIYYWRTEFKLDSLESDFLMSHDVKRMYIRFFDVVAEDGYYVSDFGEKDILPNATIKFRDEIPSKIKHVVPTVYITLDALRCMNGAEKDAASKIVHRVLNMISYNDIPNVDELQLDCDWTLTTKSIYFNLCKAVSDTLAGTSSKPISLSSTIRLHQLTQAAPPVDYGVLMCYNTGSFKNPNCKNSILDFNDVKPYLSRIIDYPIHLDIAFPIYDWTLCYRDGSFFGIIKSDSISHFSQIKNADNGLYKATTNAQLNNTLIKPGDLLRHEKSDFATIIKVRNLIYKRIKDSDTNKSIILYHLDSRNINTFTKDEINQIYNWSNL